MVVIAVVNAIRAVHNSGDGSRVELSVLVTPPEAKPQSILDVADRLDYADELMRVFMREPGGFRNRVRTLFVPLDSSLEESLAEVGRSLADLQSPSSLSRRLVRIHSTSDRIDFKAISTSGSISFTTISGQVFQMVYDRSNGAISLVGKRGVSIEVVATDVYSSDIVVHLIASPIGIPQQG